MHGGEGCASFNLGQAYICSSSSIRPLYIGVQLLVRPEVARYAVGWLSAPKLSAPKRQADARTHTRAGIRAACLPRPSPLAAIIGLGRSEG